MSTQTAETMQDRAERLFEEVSAKYGLSRSDMSAAVRAAVDDARQAVSDAAQAVRQKRRDHAELDAKADLLPQAGLQRLRAEIDAEEKSLIDSATHRGQRALKELEAALVDAALPKPDKAREALARQELALIVGDGNGVNERVLSVAQSGSRDAQAALLHGSFGRSLLEARGLSGRSLVEALDAARSIVARSTANRADATASEMGASRALEGIAGLGAAVGLAGTDQAGE
jgi:soluble cytochrome b562